MNKQKLEELLDEYGSSCFDEGYYHVKEEFDLYDKAVQESARLEKEILEMLE